MEQFVFTLAGCLLKPFLWAFPTFRSSTLSQRFVTFLGIGAGMRSVSLVPLTPVRRDTGAARSGRLILCPNEAAHAISCAPKRSKKMTQPVPLDTGVKRREALSMQPPRRAIVLVASGVRGRQ